MDRFCWLMLPALFMVLASTTDVTARGLTQSAATLPLPTVQPALPSLTMSPAELQTAIKTNLDLLEANIQACANLRISCQDPVQNIGASLRLQLQICQGLPGAAQLLAPFQTRLAGLLPAFLPPGLNIPIAIPSTTVTNPLPVQQGPLQEVGNTLGLPFAAASTSTPTSSQPLLPSQDTLHIVNATQLLQRPLVTLPDPNAAADHSAGLP